MGGDRKTFEFMHSNKQIGTLGSVASLLAQSSQENHDMNLKLWNIVSTERYMLHIQVLLDCCYIYMKS